MKNRKGDKNFSLKRKHTVKAASGKEKIDEQIQNSESFNSSSNSECDTPVYRMKPESIQYAE